MSGLRNKKKQDTRKRILECAGRMFGEKGFSRTTTADIAREADIGEGTLFNYFSTKGELFIATVFKDYQPEKYIPPWPLTVNERTLTDETLSLLKHYFQDLSRVDKRSLREYFAIMYGNDIESPLLLETIVKADEAVLESLRAFYEGLKASKKLPLSFDTEMAVKCVYGLVVSQFTFYAYTEEYMFDDMMRDMEQAVRFILYGHVPGEVC